LVVSCKHWNQSRALLDIKDQAWQNPQLTCIYSCAEQKATPKCIIEAYLLNVVYLDIAAFNKDCIKKIYTFLPITFVDL
jgi:hypothetical protein